MVDHEDTAFARGLHSRTNSFDENRAGPVTRAIAAMQGSVDQPTPLSVLFRCPVLRDVFRRAERDNDGAFAMPAPKSPVLDGGATFHSARALVLA